MTVVSGPLRAIAQLGPWPLQFSLSRGVRFRELVGRDLSFGDFVSQTLA
jgi:hypothetical protein